MSVPAIVAAGDRRAAKAIRGESKPYLELGGRTLVAHAVLALQEVPEVSDVWVVGDAARLEAVLGDEAVRGRLRKRLTIVPQFRNLFENVWQTFRRTLPGAGPGGRDPGPGDEERAALFLSADIPFATPEEISAFVRQSLAGDCDYALGLTGEEAMEDFYPVSPGEPGIHMAYFVTREGRLRQNNLHLVRPARLGNRNYIEEMYEHRYQRELGNILKLAWRMLFGEGGGLRVVFYYGLLQLAGWADRNGHRRTAEALRRRLPLAIFEDGVSGLLRTRFRFVVTEAGGCAVDIDNEQDLAAAERAFERWRADQQAKARKLYGPLALAAGSGSPELRVLGEEAK